MSAGLQLEHPVAPAQPVVRPSPFADDPLRFAYWVPAISTGYLASRIEQQFGWDLDYNVKLAQIAEQAGFQYGLTATRFKEWKTLADALPTRFAQALAAAAKLLEPKAQHVKLTGGTIKNEDDLRGWLTTAEKQIRDKLKDGPVIL